MGWRGGGGVGRYQAGALLTHHTQISSVTLRFTVAFETRGEKVEKFSKKYKVEHRRKCKMSKHRQEKCEALLQY